MLILSPYLIRYFEFTVTKAFLFISMFHFIALGHHRITVKTKIYANVRRLLFTTTKRHRKNLEHLNFGSTIKTVKYIRCF
ncbi:MAG: hypothetical protein C5S38_02600 [Candidatus Methanophagaceae archaeon]|nr:MAG: hypothetical protein C5S38_02600 [Methanophagales archaeon]